MKKELEGRIFFVVNEGEIVYASNSFEAADGYATDKTYDDLQYTADEFGYDLEELDEDDLDELAFASGFDGGYYYVDYVDLPTDVSISDLFEFKFETDKGDVFFYLDLKNVYEEDDELCDNYDDEF